MIASAWLVAGLMSPVLAQENPPGKSERVSSLQIDNDDWPGGSELDRHYTNGLRVATQFALKQHHEFFKWMKKHVPLPNKDQVVFGSFALGQNMYTPCEIDRGSPGGVVDPTRCSTPITQDRPFGGWTYAEFGITSRPDAPSPLNHDQSGVSIRDAFIVSIGWVGASTGAEGLQRLVHKIQEARQTTWNNQLRTEPTLAISYSREWRIKIIPDDGGLTLMDMTSRLGATAGNVFNEIQAGAIFGFGPDLTDDFGASQFRPGMTGALLNDPDSGNLPNWYLFAGFEGRLVAHNIFLDGSLIRKDRQSVRSRTTVWDWQFGITLPLHRWRISYMVVGRSKEFIGQRKPNRIVTAQASITY